jgi:hypothetical protein
MLNKNLEIKRSLNLKGFVGLSEMLAKNRRTSPRTNSLSHQQHGAIADGKMFTLGRRKNKSLN